VTAAPLDLPRRLRRNRQAAWTRRLCAENGVTAADLIWPLFICEGTGERQDIAALPGQHRWSIDLAIGEIRAAMDDGIGAFALFPVVPPAQKSADAAEASNSENLLCRAVRAIKAGVPDAGLICDVALDPYTADGHDGITDGAGRILNDETVALLCRQAEVLAAAGCDYVAPSDMMDGRVGAIRAHLDKTGLQAAGIISYAAKYASAFYGPFRQAVGAASAGQPIDKTTYQLSPANRDEALREAAEDVAEGADMLIVKPGLPYLDILRAVKDRFGLPTLAYHVSGEYAMLKAAAAIGSLDYDRAVMETMLCFKRAGADAVLTYAARDIARLLKKA
jgi:porphobilinogen synthase